MTWAKLDDRFHSHPKVEQASLAAVGLYCKALSYAACYETDGHIPEAWVRKQRNSAAVRQLLELGMWEECPDGCIIRDFLDFNPSKAELSESRKKGRERVRKWRQTHDV